MQLNYKGLWAAASLLVAVFFSCGKGSGKSSSPIVAEVGDVKFTMAELKEALPQPEGVEISEVQAQNYLQRWLDKEIIYQQALEEGFTKDPEVRKKLREIERDYVFALYIRKNIDEKVTVSETELRTYYDSKGGEFIRPENYYDLQIIFTQSSANADEAFQRLKSGESFGIVAKELSEHESKNAEGRVEKVPLSVLPEALKRKIPTMKLGEISQPIQTPIGYYVVKLAAVYPRGEKQSFEEARKAVEQKVKAYKRDQEYNRLLNELKDKRNASINWGELRSLYNKE
ncbi:MAG: peptidyl-prolyl cis-trans isomerase [candidate division KSB1 bacterium]|nr:peptidyl-prolyl cis-trans isomerase [candidate division KSB1 bacterium]